MQVCDCDCLPVRPLEGDLPAFSAAIFRRDDVHKALVQQQSRKLEQVAAVLQRADSPTSPLPAELPGKPRMQKLPQSTFFAFHLPPSQAIGYIQEDSRVLLAQGHMQHLTTCSQSTGEQRKRPLRLLSSGGLSWCNKTDGL